VSLGNTIGADDRINDNTAMGAGVHHSPMLDRVTIRCEWAGSDPDYLAYHDEEWGVPVHDERHLFEMVVLEGAQAGLSWLTILRRRAGYRAAFQGFDPDAVARFGPADVDRMMADPGIVRNRAKIESAISNARATIALRASGGLDALVWSAVDGVPPVTAARSIGELPAETDGSRTLSKALKQHGFSFVGPTATYAFMEAVGIVNDHVVGCFRRDEVARVGS
jgi:DNA-3-methyladenine glycosylase I